MMPAVEELRCQFACIEEGLAPVVYLNNAESPVPLGEASIAIGAFDGFHRGHQDLVRYMREDAAKRGIKSVIVTFDPDPDCVVGLGPAPKLMTYPRRLKALAASGVSAVLVIPFTRELAALDHEAFFEEVLAPVVSIRSVHVGSDFRLGRGGASDVTVIRAWAQDRGIEVFGHDLVCSDGSAISSTRIRGLLASGDVEGAAQLLGRFHAICGAVEHGRGQGTGMGFPTANVTVTQGLAVPADGVYEGIILIDDAAYPAAVNVGLPPMFAGDSHSAHLEANVIGYSGDLYGKEVALAFTRFLRPSQSFPNKDVLIQTVLGNIQDIEDHLGSKGVAL